MRKFKLAPWALAAIAAVALPGAQPARAASSPTNAQLLAAELPEGVTLAKASVGDTVKALSAAASKHPELAVGLTKVAVRAKTPKSGQGEANCSTVSKIVSAAINAAPAQSSDITQMALSMHPECADSLNNVLSTPYTNAPDGFDTPSDQYGGFGVGFGPGFPGSPGFVGSPPSGAIALPPSAVTSTVNT